MEEKEAQTTHTNHIKTIDATPAAEPEVIVKEKTVVVEKKSGGGCKWLLLGCLAFLLVLCCLCCCLGVFAPNLLATNVAPLLQSTSLGKDPSLQRITENDRATLEKQVEIKDQIAATQSGIVTVEYTEKELLYKFNSNADVEVLENLGLDITAGEMKMQFDMNVVVAQLGNQIPEEYRGLLSDLYPSIVVTPSAAGDSLEIKSLTTGNTIVDGLIADQINNEIEKGFAYAFDGLVNARVKNITFGNDSVKIVYDKTQAPRRNGI